MNSSIVLHTIPSSEWTTSESVDQRVLRVPSSRTTLFTRYQLAVHSEQGYLQRIPLIECGIMHGSSFQAFSMIKEPHSKEWYALPSHLPSLFLRLTLPSTVNPETCHVTLLLHGLLHELDSSLSLKQSTPTK